MSNHRQAWNQADVDFVYDARESGKDVSIIARQLGRSSGAITVMAWAFNKVKDARSMNEVNKMLKQLSIGGNTKELIKVTLSRKFNTQTVNPTVAPVAQPVNIVDRLKQQMDDLQNTVLETISMGVEEGVAQFKQDTENKIVQMEELIKIKDERIEILEEKLKEASQPKDWTAPLRAKFGRKTNHKAPKGQPTVEFN